MSIVVIVIRCEVSSLIHQFAFKIVSMNITEICAYSNMCIVITKTVLDGV